MFASFGITVPTTLFKVMAVRLNAPELNIATKWKKRTSYQLGRPVVPVHFVEFYLIFCTR